MPKQNQKPKKKKRDWRHTMVAIFAGVMVLLMLLPMLTMVLQSAGAVTTSELQDQIAASKAEAAELGAKIKELNAQIKAIESDKSKAQEQKNLLDQQIKIKLQEIANVEGTIAQYDGLIAAKVAEVADTQAKEERQYQLFCERVRAMEESGTVNYWDILFSAADFTDLLDRATFVSEVMEYDNAVMDELAATRKALLEQQMELETARSEQQVIRDDLELKRQALDGDLATVTQLLKSIQGNEAAAKAAKDALEAEADRIGNDITQKQKELAAKMAEGQISFDPSSGWQWPIAGHYTVTSLFANRKHPITGVYGHHTGTDIAAPNGTSIKAAANGIVLISTYGNSYGNYVVIQHQNGIQTLYAHMSSRNVKEGAVVNQGDVIGYVGSTGSSTGNHLHLEFRVNGVRQDALAYYPSINFDLSRCD